MTRLIPAFLCAIGGALLLSAAAAAGPRHPSNASSSVVVPHGQPVQIVLAGDLTGYGSGFEPSVLQAVRLAIIAHPALHGFPIHLSVVDAPCGNPAADVAAAQSIVANTQTVGVLGQFCSGGFDQALPVYQAAGVVVISGSATSDALPSFAPTVFDRTAVSDGDGGTAWYAQVTALPGNLAWRGAFADLLGAPPTDFADLYQDAAKMLIRSIRITSWIDRNGNLIVSRAALAYALRHTTNLPGVTCTVTINPTTGNRINDPKSLALCAAG